LLGYQANNNKRQGSFSIHKHKTRKTKISTLKATQHLLHLQAHLKLHQIPQLGAHYDHLKTQAM
jgi:hypothetical protein